MLWSGLSAAALLLAGILCSAPVLYSQNSGPREKILSILQQHSPTGFFVLDAYEEFSFALEHRYMPWKTKKDDFMEFVRGDSVESLLGSVNIVVHETYHTYSALRAFQLSEERFGRPLPGYHAFLAKDNAAMLVKRTPVFNTSEIADSIPERLRTFRFATYIAPDPAGSLSATGSKAWGVYGLLNEYSAYYHGNKAALDLYPYYRDVMPPGPAKWHDYFSGINRSFSANVEFRFFILKYLQYAKEHHPLIYSGIMENREFVLAYHAVSKQHEDLSDEYFRIKKEVFTNLEKEGYTVTEDAENMYTGKGASRYGSSHHLAAYYLLRDELEKPEYRTIMKQ